MSKKKLNDLNVFEGLSNMCVIVGNTEEGFKLCLGEVIVKQFKSLDEAKKWYEGPFELEDIAEIAIAVVTTYDKHKND